jgi:hypothetical protein
VTGEDNYENQPPPVSASTAPPDPLKGPQVDPTDLIARQSDVVTVADPAKNTPQPVPSK